MEEQKINVLYIDDEPNNIVSFKAAFRRVFNIFSAESAEEGKKVLGTGNHSM
jgi:response regulator RpfG family c-di-GMP phosphodiesterase